MNLDIPFKQSSVTGLAPVTTNGALVADYINMGEINKVFIICTFTQAQAFASLITIRQATAAAGTGVKDLAKVIPIYACADVDVSDVPIKQTSAVSFSLAATAKNQKVIFVVHGDDLDVANDFDWLNVTIDASSQVTDFVCVEYIAEPRNSMITLIA